MEYTVEVKLLILFTLTAVNRLQFPENFKKCFVTIKYISSCSFTRSGTKNTIEKILQKLVIVDYWQLVKEKKKKASQHKSS